MKSRNTLTATFNRTSLELKQIEPVLRKYLQSSFNRTSLELKLGSLYDIDIDDWRF